MFTTRDNNSVKTHIQRLKDGKSFLDLSEFSVIVSTSRTIMMNARLSEMMFVKNANDKRL